MLLRGRPLSLLDRDQRLDVVAPPAAENVQVERLVELFRERIKVSRFIPNLGNEVTLQLERGIQNLRSQIFS